MGPENFDQPPLPADSDSNPETESDEARLERLRHYAGASKDATREQVLGYLDSDSLANLSKEDADWLHGE